jgi:L-galactose dehydrogenase
MQTNTTQPPEVRAACAEAAARCAALGANISDVALRFSLQHPSIATTLVGMAAPAVVRANVASALAAVGEGKAGSEEKGSESEARAEVERILAPVQGVTWPSGRPENAALPWK